MYNCVKSNNIPNQMKNLYEMSDLKKEGPHYYLVPKKGQENNGILTLFQSLGLVRYDTHTMPSRVPLSLTMSNTVKICFNALEKETNVTEEITDNAGIALQALLEQNRAKQRNRY